ncbi:monocarboxylate transporter 6-like isoform X2 [Glandiceps talaboti]
MEEGTEPDGGWGWIIVFSTHVAFLLNTGFYASMGVFFVALLNYFEESATSTSVVIAISGATAAIAGPVAGYFVRKFGERLTMLAGGIVGTIGLIANTFAPSLEFMYFSHGVLLGVAAGVSSVASTSILSSYFRKRHALASSIAYTGASVGIMDWFMTQSIRSIRYISSRGH